jgi:RNA polymerase sigma-H factor
MKVESRRSIRIPDAATDDELVVACREGDAAARDVLLKRFRPFARSLAEPYLFAAGDRDGVVQEAMIGLFEAIRDFDPSDETRFITFADVCISRHLVARVRATTSQPDRLGGSSSA